MDQRQAWACGDYGETAVFGIFERDGKVYTEIVLDCAKATLQGIIRGRMTGSKGFFEAFK